MLRLRTLGRIRLQNSEGVDVLTGHRKELALLAFLTRRAGRATSRAELADLLWGDREDSKARHSLRQAFANLRTVLGPALETGPEEVRLAAGAVDIDVVDLLGQLSNGQLSEEMAGWRGDFLAGADDLGGECFRAWLEAEREGLRRQIALSLERLHTDAKRRGQWHDAANWAERWAELQPYDERPKLAVLDALHRSGRTAEALAHHRIFVTQLSQDLGAAPSAEFLARGEEIERGARAQWAQGPSPGSAALFSPDLIGRRAALAELTAAWEGVHSGQSAVVLVEGEDGLGKTRVCVEFLRTIEHEPAFVLRTRGVEPAAAGAHSAVAGDVDHWTTTHELLAGLRAAPGLSGAADQDLAALSRFAPALRERFPNLPEPPADERTLLSALANVLNAVAAEVPVVVFVDDFTSVDARSRELLAGLAERLPGAGVLLLLTLEPEARPRSGGLAGLFDAPRVRRLRLRPLDAAELEALIASMLACSADVRAQLAHHLHEETGGNPLFATEILASLVDDGRLAPDADGLWHLAPVAELALPLPVSIRDAVRRRLQRLSESARLTLSACAAAAGPWEPRKSAGTLGTGAAELALAIDELIARRFIHEEVDRTGAVRYRLSHPLLRRIVLEGNGPENGVVANRAEHVLTPHAAPKALVRVRTRARNGALATAGIAAIATGVLLARIVLPRHTTAAPPAPVLAVGLIRDYAGSDSTGLANALPEMLATNLARVPVLRMVGQARLYEITAQLGERTLTASALARAARQAGAQQLVEGELYAAPGGGYRLDLRRIALATGAVQAAHRIHGRDFFQLVDDATSRLSASLGKPSNALRLADVTTESVVAYRLYEEGLRGFYLGDMKRASALFRAAIKEDSTFALPAYYALLAEQGLPYDSALVDLLFRTLDAAPERERLAMRARLAVLGNEPAAIAVAETLTIRYPAEPEGHLLLGHALDFAGQPTLALPRYERVIALDSLSLRGKSARCRACEAYSGMIRVLTDMDSAAAAERKAREWIQLQPEAALPWFALTRHLESQGRLSEAEAAIRHAASGDAGNPYVYVFPAMAAIRRGDFRAADASLREQARVGPPAVQELATWFLIISLRYQGRFGEALQLARRLRAMQPEPAMALVEAQVLFEMGRHHEAAALFHQVAVVPKTGRLNRTASATARHRVWFLTHTATALAAAGDTNDLAMLADTIEKLGALSLYGRDRKLHHYVRGLLLSARGTNVEAAAAFRAATNWPTAYTSHYNRTNFELARALLALGRPRAAIPALQLGLTGPLESSYYYMSRSELHALLGRTYEAIGERDSAAVHYRWTLRAWRNADATLSARRDSLRSRLAAIERPAAVTRTARRIVQP